MASVNYLHSNLSKNGQKFAMKLLSKDINYRPNSQEALEDEIFCSNESGINVGTDFIETKYMGGILGEPRYTLFTQPANQD